MKPQRPTWLEIDLGAISNNIRQLLTQIEPDCILMGVIKANAYGHGAIKVAQTLVHAGTPRLAVATLMEAIELRHAQIEVPILVLGYTPANLVAVAVEKDITLTVYDHETAEAIAQSGASQAKTAVIHVKVNTGMNRLGLRPQDAPAFLTHLADLSHLQVEGIYTHFANADAADQSFALEQFQRFETMLVALESIKLRPPIAHTANSAAMLSLPETHLEMVRPGIAIYGLHPDPKSNRLPAGFRPTLAWKAQIADIHMLEAGETVGYGREFRADHPLSIAVIPVGYADGFPRKPYHWKYVLVQGKPAPVIGRVCMDQTMIDISSLHPPSLAPDDETKGSHHMLQNDEKEPQTVAQGDEVILIGAQGNAILSVDDVAEQIGTNNYDVVSRILSRVPRIYV